MNERLPPPGGKTELSGFRVRSGNPESDRNVAPSCAFPSLPALRRTCGGGRVSVPSRRRPRTHGPPRPPRVRPSLCTARAERTPSREHTGTGRRPTRTRSPTARERARGPREDVRPDRAGTHSPTVRERTRGPWTVDRGSWDVRVDRVMPSSRSRTGPYPARRADGLARPPVGPDGEATNHPAGRTPAPPHGGGPARRPRSNRLTLGGGNHGPLGEPRHSRGGLRLPRPAVPAPGGPSPRPGPP